MLTFGILAAPAAITTGMTARRQIAERPDLTGARIATAGAALGFAWMITATVILSLLLFPRIGAG